MDIAPLLLTIAAGGNGWRSDGRFSYLQARGDIAAVAADPGAAGRPWVAHATDDMSVEEMATLMKSPAVQKMFGGGVVPTEIPTSAPSHIVAVRTPDAKFGRYSYWQRGSMETDRTRRVDYELYDYESPSGAHELDNLAGRSAKQAKLQGLLDNEVLPELRAPLPAWMHDAQEQGMADMQRLTVARAG